MAATTTTPGTAGDGNPARAAGLGGVRWLALSLGCFAVLAGALFAAATLADREASLEAGWHEAETTTALIAGRAESALRVAEVSTARLAREVLDHGLPTMAAGTGLAPIMAETPELAALLLRDGAGRLLAASPPPRAGRADAPPALALAALEAGAPGHLGAQPPGALTPLPSLVWSRPLRGPEGLIGLAQAVLRGEEFAGPAQGEPLGEQARLALLHADGSPLLRWPQEAPPAIESPRAGASGRALERGPDGVMRLVAWQAAPSMPVVAVAAQSEAAVMAPFRRRLFRNGLLFGLSAALAGALGFAAIAAERRGRAVRLAAEQRGTALAQALAEREGLLASVREGEARLRLAEQAGGIGLWDWDLRDGTLALAGASFAGWGLGARRSLPARLALAGFAPEDRAALGAALAVALRGDGPLEGEFRLARPRGRSGQPRWIALRAELQRDLRGQPVRLLGIALEVTARRAASDALAEANALLEQRVAERTGALAEAMARLHEGEARFHGIFDATFQLTALLSPDGTVLEANEALRQLGGGEPAEVLGQPYWAVPGWPGDPTTQATLREAVAGAAAGRFMRRELALPGPQGGTRALDVSVKPVRDEDGIVSLLVAEGRDVSDLKAAQALLLEAQKMDTLGQLTGGVAHDFNNLLMAVMGNLALARRRLGPNPPAELLRHIEAAVQGAERGAQLTRRLLAFARRQDLRPAAIDLPRLLDGMADLLRRSAGPLTEVVVEAPADLPPAHVDGHALELALMNLAVNARDAMPEGGRLSIRLADAPPGAAGRPKGLPAGRFLRITVADTGHGMDAATLARAIEPFFSTKQPGQGTGLGLSMVHGLAHQSGGALTIESAPGQGTVATLWLPVSDALPLAEAARAEAEPAGGSGAVLVVDDEPLVLESTAAMLEALGYLPVAAASGEAALAALEARPDLVAVLTDHAMPGITGAVLAERIAARRPGLPVLLATGHAGALGEVGAGMAGRLSKPYGLAQLASALDAVLRRPAAE